MKLSVERQGELFIWGGVVLWSFFPIITFLSYGTLSPFISLAASSLFASLFFAVILTIRKRWYEVLNTEALKHTLLATLFVGI